MAEDPIKPPNRELQRDTGVLIPRVFNFNNGKFGNLPRDDKIAIDTYRTMMNDAQIRAGIEVVTLATIGSGWEFNFPLSEDPDKADEILKFIRSTYGNLNKTHGIRADLFQVFREVLTALWAGFSVTEKVWGKDSKGNWVIQRYKVLPPETIKFNINKQGKLSPTEAVEQSYTIQEEVKLPARKINLFIVNPKFGSPWGESILKPVYNNWYVKDWLVKFHASYMENLGSPILIGKTNRDTITMNNALQEARNSSVITLSESEEVDILNAGGSGEDFESAIRYHDAQIMRGMLVPSLLVGQDEAMGSRALSEVHFEVFKLSRIGALQQQLKTWINNDIREMVRLNYGDFDMYPELTFKSWSRSDQQRLSTMMVDLVNAQIISPNEAWIREFLELPDAGDDYDPKAFPDASSPNSPTQPTREPENREVPPQVRTPGDDAQRDQLEQLNKGPMEQFVFVDKDMCIVLSEEIGFEGRVHSSVLGDGTIVWTPGTEEEFFIWYESNDAPFEEIEPDVFTTEQEAQARADEIGCDTTHFHDTPEGRVYMPCKTHEIYKEKIGELALYPKKKKKKKKKTYESRLAEDDYPDINDLAQLENTIASFADSRFPHPTKWDKKNTDRILSIILTRGGVALSETERRALQTRERLLLNDTGDTDIGYLLGIESDDGSPLQANE